MMRRYFTNILIAVDQLIGTVLFGTMPDETISAAQWRLKRKWAVAMIDWIFSWVGEKNHCESSYYHEVLMQDLPEEYRKGREHPLTQ